MIKFYCKKCGKQMWELADWKHICRMTLEQVESQLVCSDCLLDEARKAEQ